MRCLSLLLCAVFACERLPERRALGAQVLNVRAPSRAGGAPGAADGSETRPFESIGEALRRAPSGAVVMVDAGTFQERLVLTRPVVLVGRGPGRTRILGTPGEVPQPPVVEVAGADHVELRGLAIERGTVGLRLSRGAGVRLEDVAVRDFSEAGIAGEAANLAMSGCEVIDIGHAHGGHGIELEGGSLDAKDVVLRGAGRRALVLQGTRATLTDLDESGSMVSALQAVDGADVHVVRGRFERNGGAALYAGRAKLAIDAATIAGNEYGVIGFRGAEVTITGAELDDHVVAAVALVRSKGSVQGCHIVRGGSEAAIAITHATASVALVDNRIQEPGPMGLHITESTVAARGNTITGAHTDRQRELGDGVFAINSTVRLDQNVVRGNAGSGVTMMSSELSLTGNGLLENGRAGLSLLNRSHATAQGNFFQSNAAAGVEVAETSRATLTRNRFGGNPHFDIDVVCGAGGGGEVELGSGNTFAGEAAREHVCP